MWEKIVLNLISNAFKFTFEGEIGVELSEHGDQVRLTVRDTGVGIPADELPKLFDRFHRVEGTRGRSFEGSGIGLALVQELVEQHGGKIEVESEEGRGSSFMVALPLGAAHLPQEHVESSSDVAPFPVRADSFVEEALRWLPGADAGMLFDIGAATETKAAGLTFSNTQRQRILLADDNADLRAYIARLLTERGFEVEAVVDGAAALEAARARRPDLLITDVMMPRLNGFGLLGALREDPALGDLPVIILSARAGEEAKVEGLHSGADDYLIKPFSARELIARVSAVISMSSIRREAREAVRASEVHAREQAERVELALEAGAIIGTWVLEIEGDRFVGDERFARAFGLDPELCRKGLLSREHVRRSIHPEDLPSVEAAVGEALATGGPYRCEYRVRAQDGAFRWIEANGRVDLDDEGKPIRFPGVLIDIDHRHKIEAQLRTLNEELEARVAKAVAARQAAEEALRQAMKMEAVGQLTGGIAHDFNNLLTVITGNVDTARRALSASETARASRSMENALKGAERAAALTQRLLAFSRLQPLEPKVVNVDRLVTGMADLLHRALGETVELETVSTPGLWLVEADRNQLENAIVNLAINARDAMPDGGKLTIETANAWLDEQYSGAQVGVTPGAYVAICVTDTGEGMSKHIAERAFDPYFTTKEVGKGTGLGLSMVYGFVKQSGGHVKIYSEPGEGTAVKIYLPRVLSGQEEASAPIVEAQATTRAHTILIVEDDDGVRNYTVEMLRELGYRVLQASDGPTALALIEGEERQIDLLFTDVVMPNMSGRDLADRATALKPNLKVLYTSGYTRNAIVHGGRLDLGVEMIAKPFTYQTLARKIGDLLDANHRGRVLVAAGDPAARMFAVEALEGAGFGVDEAATASEAFGRVRSARGRYAAVILDEKLPEKPGDALAAELRAIRSDLPLLIAAEDGAGKILANLASDRYAGVIQKPFNSSKLLSALTALGVTRR
jgi:PAS domain S-box-containing protein